MPQIQLPIFPVGATHITSELAFQKIDGYVTYFNGHMPVFRHPEDDLRSFRMITAQFCVNGVVKQSRISEVFGVPLISVKRAVKKYRGKGAAGFYEKRRSRGPAVLTPPVLAKAQELLHQGMSAPKVAETLAIKYDTLKKAVQAGKLKKPQTESKKTSEENRSGGGSTNKSNATSKSVRSAEDNNAPMGMGATDTEGRVLASVGKGDGAKIDFKAALDICNAGVMLALPALLANGLLRHTKKHFALPKGYYRLESIFILLAFMALARLKCIERLRYNAPGEWGKLLGLDRAPEVRTLREKVANLTQQGQAEEWNAQLCENWMNESPEDAKVLYIDGHVRVYHGEQTKLPRHYVARQKLCLRATVDYWVNAMDGRPFF